MNQNIMKNITVDKNNTVVAINQSTNAEKTLDLISLVDSV